MTYATIYHNMLGRKDRHIIKSASGTDQSRRDKILTANTKKHEYHQRFMDKAFSKSGAARSKNHTVDTLMKEGGRLILVIQKYAATLETQQASQEGPSSPNTDKDMNDTHFDADENEKDVKARAA